MRDGGPLTRFELGKQIAMMYAHHFGVRSELNFDPGRYHLNTNMLPCLVG